MSRVLLGFTITLGRATAARMLTMFTTQKQKEIELRPPPYGNDILLKGLEK